MIHIFTNMMAAYKGHWHDTLLAGPNATNRLHETIPATDEYVPDTHVAQLAELVAPDNRWSRCCEEL